MRVRENSQTTHFRRCTGENVPARDHPCRAGDDGIRPAGRGALPQSRLAARQAHSLPVLAQLRAWLDKTRPQVVPSLALGKALAYLDKYWSKLTRYVERGDLPIDNNRCENAIRPFVVGRKNWLFSNTPAGAHASALIYSLVETAKANGREPYTWLRTVLRELPRASTVEDYEALLPWNLDLETLAVQAIDAASMRPHRCERNRVPSLFAV